VIGFHDQGTDAPVYLQIAQLCIKAGSATRQSEYGLGISGRVRLQLLRRGGGLPVTR
jgi:hypothetical protein